MLCGINLYWQRVAGIFIVKFRQDGCSYVWRLFFNQMGRIIHINPKFVSPSISNLNTNMPCNDIAYVFPANQLYRLCSFVAKNSLIGLQRIHYLRVRKSEDQKYK